MGLLRQPYRGHRGAGRHDNPDAWRSDIARRGVGHFAIHASRAERIRVYQRKKRQTRHNQIGIIDFETDPFNRDTCDVIYPFACCIHRIGFPDIIIWDECYDTFVNSVISELEAIPGNYVFYAHNGGKFDYMFLIHKIRGAVSFKGRGLMVATIGNHEIRDSFHIIPERLANWHKDNFDYSKMSKPKRQAHKDEIIRYMQNDCIYLMEIVRKFVQDNGLKLSIGQASISRLRKFYYVKRITEFSDEQLRPYYFGGRVECLQGKGHYVGRYRLVDVNSMYPSVMAFKRHPIGNIYLPRRGYPNANTAFVNLNCQNYGAFVSRGQDGSCSATAREGNFLVSIHEFEAALKHNLIDDIDIHWCIDCNEFSTFEKFVLPIYDIREQIKAKLKEVEKGTEEYNELFKDSMFYKFYLNTCYGKFAQNPRKYNESYITDFGIRPDGDDWPDLPRFENGQYAIWERPCYPWRFFNVGTGASITGGARADLLDGIVNSRGAIYCDTDSIICTEFSGEINKTKLGAWDIENEFSEVIVAGKKTYCARIANTGDIKVRSKGVAFDTKSSWDDMQRLLKGEVLPITAPGPTLTKTGRQFYMVRNVRATATTTVSPVFERMRV